MSPSPASALPVGSPRSGVTVRELTERLVGVASHEDETAAGDTVAAWLADRAETWRDDHGNVFARRNPDGARQLALVGHHDVVPPAPSQTTGEGTAGDYVVETRDGRVYGRGTADMKGSLAAAMVAVAEADAETLAAADLELLFVSFVGEEQGGVGCRAAVADGFSPAYAVVGEGSTGYSAPGVTDVAVAHRGRRASTLTVAGEAAHASEPAAGTNAVYRAADAVDAVRGLEPPTATVQGERVAGTVSVTEIDGGSAWNVVPESCSITVDERTVPGARADLAAVADRPGVSWAVEQDLPPMACDEPAFADAVLSAARGVQVDEGDVEGVADAESGSRPQHVVKPHATDAGWLADAGTTCVVCGAAEPGEAHTDTESVSLGVVRRLRRIYGRVLDEMTAV